MNGSDDTPRPLDPGGIELGSDLTALTERLAENAHETWARERLKQGWSWGRERDDAWKPHRGLVLSGERPEENKTVDRAAAMGTVRAVVALGGSTQVGGVAAFDAGPSPRDRADAWRTRPDTAALRGHPKPALPIRPPTSMKRLIAACLGLLCLPSLPVQGMEKPSAHTKGIPTRKATGPLQPGEYWWAPEVSPSGPVVVLVSIPLQVMHVYRNGILVGRSSVSTGAKGRATPSGVFSILEKKSRHYSSTYNNAPMPHMQRLTWTGIAMHSGQLPGYPASHGCIRLPYDFSRLLFTLTAKGGTVVIGDSVKPQPHFASNPGLLLAPRDLKPEMLKPLDSNAYEWRPERSTEGPVTILVSSADRTMYVYRNGTPIGRAALTIRGDAPLGATVFSMLDGESDKPSRWVPFRRARNWMAVASTGATPGASVEDLRRRLGTNPDFAAKLYDLLSPGTTIIVTDEPAIRKQVRDFAILTN